jgi:RNA polymerase sigma-70 factor (ECF subfamily)
LNIDEQRLAERLCNGENGAMGEFYTLYADQLAGVCSRYITDEDDMKDVFQESLIHIITHIKDFTYRGTGSLKAWAITSTTAAPSPPSIRTSHSAST